VPPPGEVQETLATVPLAPGRVALGPLVLTLSQVDGTWHLGLAGEDHVLEESQVLPWEDLEVWAVREGDLLHLRLEARSGLRLYELLSEGRVLALLLSPKGDYAYLRLLRGLSAKLKGEFRPEELGPRLAEKYRQAPEEALLDFARKGLEVTLRRLGGQDPEPLLLEVGQALGLEGEVRFLSLSPEPQSLKVGSAVLSLRLKEDGVYVGQAGEVPRRLKDLLVYRLAEGALILTREGRRLAYLVVGTP
jgi:hypothetical protein